MAVQTNEPTRHTVTACPNCNSSNVHSRMTMSPRYRCGDCESEFEEAKERAPGAKS